MRLSIVDRYLFREISLAWLAVSIVLFAIMISHSLLRVLVKAGDGEVNVASVLPLLIATATNLLVTIVPLGVYLGTILGLGRLYQDSEMVVLSACGVGARRLYKPVLLLGFIGLLITLPLTVWVSPWAKTWEREIEAQANSGNLGAVMRAGTFVELQGGKAVLFARSFSERGFMQDVFLWQKTADGREALEVSRQALYQKDLQSGDQYLVFVDGQRTTFATDNSEQQVISFDKHGVQIPASRQKSARHSRSSQATTTLRDSTNRADRAEFYWRIGIPLAAPVLAFLALPLAYTSPRQGRYGKVALAILIYIFYTNLLVLSRKWIVSGQLPEWVGLWWVHILVLMLAALLLNTVYRLRWFSRSTVGQI